MRQMLLSFLMGVLALSGCSNKGSAKSGDPGAGLQPSKATPAEKLYEQLRGGVFQMNQGLDAIEEALKEAKASPAPSVDLKQSLEDIEASIDSAGANLGDEAAEEPDKNLVASDMAKAEGRRLKLIDLVNDSLHDLRDARGIVDSLAGENEIGPLEAVGVKIDEAMDALRGSLEALGGKEEIEE